MSDHPDHMPLKKIPWNKARFTGPKPPLKPKQIWAIRVRLQMARRTRDLALFDLALDSKLGNVAKQDFNTLVRHAAALKFSGYFTSDTFVLVETAVVGCDLGRHTIFERGGFLSARHVGALNLHMRSLPDRTAVVWHSDT